MAQVPAMAWLLSRFPAHNHAFMLREIERMEKLGCSILPIAISDPDRPPEQLTAGENAAFRRTWYLNRESISSIATAQIRVLARNPGGWLRGLRTALTFSGWEWPRIPANLKYFFGAVMIGDRLERQGIHWVHSHYTSTVAYLLGVTFAGRIAYSLTVHGSGEFEDVRGFRLAEKIQLARFVIAISSFGRSQMMKITPPQEWHKLRVIRLGIDPALYRPATPDPSAPFTVVTAGMLVSVKGYPLLLEAIAALRRQGRSVRLRLAGDGVDRPQLEEQARRLGLLPDAVEFLGWVAGDRLPEIYGSADALVLSSFAEGIPVVLMEAMAMGVPCVAPAIGGIGELIENRVSGLLVPAGDADAIATAIGMLIDSPPLRAAIAAAGREVIATRYSLDANTTALAHALKEISSATDS